ncbi:CPBP family intramembrane glutamic endopeptidase [Herbiconiux sp. KACC 21604]|uniref:CPBP family intramembrane glutamic endopeptidase n=1 Tax=unclassified Herbiconiux TaxID=2618217 RepID=UPI0020A273A2|nr:CPBP family intramembrane glutamic endopeptidase [Herbiconiux sp. SALV-R1]WPO88742.1 CPBP family intramembrane glutamic endopeptidase [Herbiconiux sp. KACC 21604]
MRGGVGRAVGGGAGRGVGFARAMAEARRPTGIVLGSIVAVGVTVAIFQLGPVLRVVLPAEVLEQGGIVALAPAFLVAWLLLWAWLRFKEQRPFASIGFREPSRAGWRVARGAGIALAQMGVYLAIGVATSTLVFAATPDGSLLHTSALGWAAIALLAFAVQSGAEEIVARGYLVQVWYPRTGVLGAVIVSALYFTVAHSLSDEFSILPLLDMTLYSVLAVFWVLTERGLWGLIAYHATWNWAQGSLFGVSVSGTDVPNSLFVVNPTPGASTVLSGGDYGAEGSLVDIVVLLVLTAIAATLFFRTRRARRTTDAHPTTHTETTARP